MGTLDPPRVDKGAQRLMQFMLPFQMDPRRSPVFYSVHRLQVGRASQAEQRILLIDQVSEQDDDIPFLLEPLRCYMLWLLNPTDHGDSGRGINGTVWVL